MNATRLALALIVLVSLFQAVSFQRVENYGADASYYQSLASSLLESRAYKFNFREHVLYPPGLPLILATAYSTFGTSYQVGILLMPFFGFLGLLFAFLLLRLLFNEAIAVIATLSMAFSPYYFSAATRTIGSDLLYFAISFVLLFVLERREMNRSNSKWSIAFAAATLLPAALLTRSVGVSLAAAFTVWVSYLLLYRRLKAAIVFIPAIVLTAISQIGWSKFQRHHAYSDWANNSLPTYSTQFWLKDPHRPELGSATVLEVLQRVAENLFVQAAHIAELLLPVRWIDPLWFSPILLGVLMFLALGLIAAIRSRGLGISELYCGFYCTVVLLWPFDEGARFILPIYPLVVGYVFSGVGFAYRDRLLSRLNKRWAIIPFAVAVIAGIKLNHDGGRFSIQVLGSLFLLLSLAATIVVAPKVSELVVRMSKLRRFSRFAAAALVSFGLFTLVLIGFLQALSIAKSNLAISEKQLRHYPALLAARWIVTNTSTDAAIMAEEIAIIHRLTGRQLVKLPATTDAEFIRDVALRNGADFLVVTQPPEFPYFFPLEVERRDALLKSFPEMWSLVFQNNVIQIFKKSDLSSN